MIFIRVLGLLAVALGATALAVQSAQAQVQPPLDDVVAQGEILNRAIDQATGAPRSETDTENNEIDGEAGIYVFAINDIFFVSGSAGVGHTSNPTRTANDPGEDWYGEFGASIGVSTRIASAVDFSTSFNIDGRDFLDDDAASSRGVSITTAAGAPLFGPVYGSVIAFVGYVFDDAFDNETPFYGLSGNLSASWRLSSQFLLRPGVGVTQQWSDISENNSLSATASLDAAYVLSPEWLLSGRASISQRIYDDFYEDVTFVEREDTATGISASLAWRPNRNMTLAASVTYEDQDSTFFLSEFDAFDKGVSLSMRHSF